MWNCSGIDVQTYQKALHMLNFWIEQTLRKLKPLWMGAKLTEILLKRHSHWQDENLLRAHMEVVHAEDFHPLVVEVEDTVVVLPTEPEDPLLVVLAGTLVHVEEVLLDVVVQHVDEVLQVQDLGLPTEDEREVTLLLVLDLLLERKGEAVLDLPAGADLTRAEADPGPSPSELMMV